MKKLIFITGASSGIGRALTLKFADSGWKVIATARRIDLIKKIKKNNNISNSIIPLKIDVTNKKMVLTQVTFQLKPFLILDANIV